MRVLMPGGGRAPVFHQETAWMRGKRPEAIVANASLIQPGMDEGCENTSWQADGHRFESGVASALFFLVPLLLGLALRRLPQWRDLWLPTLLVVPVVVAVSIPFSLLGDGAAIRAASITWFLWLGLLACATSSPRSRPTSTT